MCVSVRVAGCVWPWQWPQGVIYLQRLCPCSFCYTVALFAPPLLTEMTSKHSREHACMFVCVHLISGFGDTQEGGPFFNHTVIQQSQSFCTVQVCVTISTQSTVHPSVPAQILRMRGVMLPPVTESLKSESTPQWPGARVVKPMCLTFRNFALKTAVLPKFQQDNKSIFTRFDEGLQTCPHRPL